MSGGAMRQTIAISEGEAFRRRTRHRARHLCLLCRERRSVFLYRGIVKADAHHTLCFQCYRGLLNSMRVSRLAPRVLAFPLAGRKESL
jgi:hypothetical protein